MAHLDWHGIGVGVYCEDYKELLVYPMRMDLYVELLSDKDRRANIKNLLSVRADEHPMVIPKEIFL